MRSTLAIIAVALIAAAAAAQDGAAAMADRLTFPPAEQWRYYYVTTATAATDVERTCQETALKLIVPSLSRQPILERCLPVQIGPTLWRLNLEDLRWSLRDWKSIIARYPYHASRHPLTVRADWLLLEITDASQSDAYYRLLFGKRPATRAEVFASFGVSDDPQFAYGLIAGGSPVSKTGVRRVTSLPILRGWSYLTEDVLELSGKRDPLRTPIGPYHHDGEELLIAAPKISLAGGADGEGRRGVLLNGFLFDGAGRTIDKADTALVEDYTATRGFRHIVAGLSCFSCHAKGPNGPSANVLRDAIKSGVTASVYKYGEEEALEAFHFGELATQLARESADLCAIVELATGVAPDEAVDAFRATCDVYDAEVNLERLAAELYVEPAELTLAVSWMTANRVDVGGWIPAAAQDPAARRIPRDQVEEHFAALEAGLSAWKLTR